MRCRAACFRCPEEVNACRVRSPEHLPHDEAGLTKPLYCCQPGATSGHSVTCPLACCLCWKSSCLGVRRVSGNEAFDLRLMVSDQKQKTSQPLFGVKESSLSKGALIVCLPAHTPACCP
ncbi:hypothetical protein ABFV05_020651 [Capra hircus]